MIEAYFDISKIFQFDLNHFTEWTLNDGYDLPILWTEQRSKLGLLRSLNRLTASSKKYRGHKNGP